MRLVFAKFCTATLATLATTISANGVSNNETEARAEMAEKKSFNGLLKKLLMKNEKSGSNFGLILTILGGVLFSFVQRISNAAKIFHGIFIGIPKLLFTGFQKLFGLQI